MVKRHLRTNKWKVRKRRLPSGRVGIIFRKAKTSKPRCGITDMLLNGVLYGRKRDLRVYSKTEKRPSRYYGGVLSHEGLKRKIIDEISKFVEL